uniref:Uncharacterized protein n=1 Tax=Plectus sambesii TaxID=2011161 RepID=A0A914X6T7_9BILA
MSVLESPTFALNGDAKLHFNYRRNNNASAVYVCQDTYDRELEECYRLSVWEDVHPNEWVDDYIDLVTSDTKLYIIAKFLHSNGNNVRTRTSSVSIDNIRLTDSYGNPLC